MQSRVKFNRVPEKVPEKVWEALAQSQVRFNRAPKKVPEKVWEALVRSQVRFNRVPEKVAEKVPVQGQVRFQQVQQGFQRLASQHASERPERFPIDQVRQFSAEKL